MTSIPSPAPAIAATVATSMMVAQAAEQAAEDRKRRISHEGHDQILLKIHGEINPVGEAIASLYDNWMWDAESEEVQINKGRHFAWGTAFGIWMLVALGLFILYIAWSSLFNCPTWEDSCHPPYDFIGGIAISIIAGIAVGAIGFASDDIESIDYIRVDSASDHVTVLIKKYTDEGYRTIDDDEISNLFDRLESAHLQIIT